ncbi:MAG: glycosyltransferase family 4 protein [Deltaproteobacteria bacterium]|nr:glycosyltransferase family 4 protein [Deltaproteobacteria bacterium]
MAAALRAEMDLVTLKTEALAHQSRLYESRLFRVRVTGTPLERHQAFGRAVGRQLEAQPYDVVHVRGPFSGEVVAERRGDLSFRFVYEVATYPDEAESVDAERLWDAAHGRCLEAADLILVPTEAAARALGEEGHGGKVAVVHPGVDVNAFDWWPSYPDEVARLLYLGKFSADRDLSTALAAVRTLAQERPVRALFAGEERHEARDKLRRIVRAFGLEDVVQVRAEPLAVHIPALIAGADVALVPAAAAPRFRRHGDLPEPLLEYMACRRPMVVAGVPGITDFVHDGQEGVLYEPADDASLAEGIRRLLDEPELSSRVIDAAYEQARWRYSGSARRRRIAEVYEMLVPGSQSYDAWDEAFEAEPTGLIELPSSLVPLTREPTTSSGEVEALERPATQPAALAPPDTNPSIAGSDTHAGGTEIPPSPTHVDPLAIPPDTDPGR